jgi:dTDP-4-amino-4,6-dideoxygalactose transaminase
MPIEKLMKVPFIDLKRVTALAKDGALCAWSSVVENTEFVGGATVQRFELELARAVGVKHVIGCSSGTSALCISLQAMGIGPGKKVAIPNLTFWATYEAVAQLGAIPVLVEVDPCCLQMDFSAFADAYRVHHFDAAVLVHLMGWASASLQEYRAFCREHSIPLLEDGAQAYGVEFEHRSVFQDAFASILSFFPAKVLGGCVDGGAMLTNDDSLAALFRKLANHGRSSHYSYSHVGWSSRMGGLQAAWLLEMLQHQADIVANRRRAELSYRSFFASLDDLIQSYGPPNSVAGNGYLSVCRLKHHDLAAVTAQLNGAGISIGRVYPETLDMQAPASAAIRSSDFCHSRSFCRGVVNLPLFYGITDDELHYVQSTFRSILQSS